MVSLAALLILHSAQLGWRAGTPEPVLETNPRWVQLYWKAWENTQKHVVEEESPGPFPARFIAVANPDWRLLSWMMSIAVVVVSLCLSLVVSRQRRQIDRLMEDAAILSAELRELRAGTEPAERVIANAPRNRLEARR